MIVEEDSNMLFGITILILVLLAWLGIIPVRLWLIKTKTKYYGKVTRMKIKVIKILEPVFNLPE